MSIAVVPNPFEEEAQVRIEGYSTVAASAGTVRQHR